MAAIIFINNLLSSCWSTDSVQSATCQANTLMWCTVTIASIILIVVGGSHIAAYYILAYKQIAKEIATTYTCTCIAVLRIIIRTHDMNHT